MPDRSDEPPTESEGAVWYCPLGPPQPTGRVTYAWCTKCQHVRKNRTHCVLVDVWGWNVDTDPIHPHA